MATEWPELGALRLESSEIPVLVSEDRPLALVRDLDPGFSGDIVQIFANERYEKLRAGLSRVGPLPSPPGNGSLAPPYRRPRKIWGIGLNYPEHAEDLSAPTPEEPASFIKADHTIIGPGDAIVAPWQSERVTTEAELGIVIGRYCRNVPEKDALQYVFGVCPILDQTAEDILQRNPRFLTRAKNFPTFFSFGPTVIPIQSALSQYGSLEDIEVSTVLNGTALRTNRIGNMLFAIPFLISFHSQIMPLFPGDIISTGTPGAAPVHDGDVAECRLGTMATLRNPVVQQFRNERTDKNNPVMANEDMTGDCGERATE